MYQQHQSFRANVEGLPDIFRWQFDVQGTIVCGNFDCVGIQNACKASLRRPMYIANTVCIGSYTMLTVTCSLVPKPWAGDEARWHGAVQSVVCHRTRLWRRWWFCCIYIIVCPIITVMSHPPRLMVGKNYEGVWPQQHVLWEGHLLYWGIVTLHSHICVVLIWWKKLSL